ncbi:MAG: hypothetical protein HY698_04375 [Deltaproteobacteria bacterium]|nr:hypothetical protein [Deltaproteobacteria bacterium]
MEVGAPKQEVEPARSDKYPPGIPYIVGNEGAERFSFYGMKAILYVYLAALYVKFASEGLVPAAELAAAKAKATEVTHLFVAGVYAFPLIGAILADRLLGKYKVIISVSMIYCAGHAVLAVAGKMGTLGKLGPAEWAMYLGLGLIAAGSGGIKPCVSANVGDQFTAKNSHLVSKVFQIFYFIINFGSFFSTLLTPFLYRKFGPEYAFAVPGILMGVATIVFWMGRNKFAPIPPKPGGKLGLLDTLITVLLFSPLFALIYGYFVMWSHFEPNGAEGAALLGAVMGYYAPLLIGVALAVILGFVLFNVRQRIEPDSGFLAVLVYSFRNRRLRRKGMGFFGVAKEKFGEEAAEGPSAVLKIMVVFSMVSVFWALFDQHASTWVEQAKQMNLTMTVPTWLGYSTLVGALLLALYGGTWLLSWVSNVAIPRSVNKLVLGVAGAGVLLAGVVDVIRGEWLTVTLEAAQISALNPLMVMIIIPFLNIGVFGPMQKRGIVVKPLQKMTVGMFLAALAFVFAALLQARIEALAPTGQKLHVLWQVIPYLIMTTAEVLVSVTGLEFAYTQAPRAMKSTIMGFWLLCVTFGNLLVAVLAPMQAKFALSAFFWVFASLMAGAALIFAVLAKFYRGKTYLQH